MGSPGIFAAIDREVAEGAVIGDDNESVGRFCGDGNPKDEKYDADEQEANFHERDVCWHRFWLSGGIVVRGKVRSALWRDS